MKLLTTFFTFTFALFSTIISAQNWMPINEDDVYHYELVGNTMSYDSVGTEIGFLRNNNPVDATIWIDSVEVAAGQTIYHFNKIITDCDTCMMLGNSLVYLYKQPQFLLHQMVGYDDGTYVLVGENEWYIESQAALGDSWVFDMENGISAEVTAITEGEVLGVIDSLKYIDLSNGDNILLSKAHGIIEFSDIQNTMYHNLMGIQTRNLGFKMPGFKEIYDFNVGDVFEYYYRSGGIQGGYFGDTKIAVLGKQTGDDFITYDIKRISYRADYSYTGPSGYYEEDITEETIIDTIETFTFYESDMVNAYPRQLFASEKYCTDNLENDYWDRAEIECEWGSYYMENTLSQVHFGQNDDGGWQKYLHSNGVPYLGYYAPIVSHFDPVPDTENMLFNGKCLSPYSRIWEEGLGETHLRFWCFEGGYERLLTGYVKDGDTTGIVTPDEVLLTSFDEVSENEISRIMLHPNPAIDQLHFNIQAPRAFQELEVTIYDTMGKVLKVNDLGMESSGRLDVSQLLPGVYLISFKVEDGILSRRFIKH